MASALALSGLSAAAAGTQSADRLSGSAMSLSLRGDALNRPGILWRGNRTKIAAPPNTQARSWILIDARSGEVLAAARARTKQFPASTLKTLTAVTLLPKLDLNEVYTARANDVGIHGSGAGLVVGGTYTVEQLFLGMLLPSGNDAAVALTHVYNADSQRAIRLMNRTARALGTTGTTAKTPHGLPDPHQVTTAADMAIIARAAIANPTFRRLARTKIVNFPGRMPKPGKTRQTYQLQNENPFIKHEVPGAIAGKTGYTRAALRTYWVAVKRGDRTLLTVILGFIGSYQELATRILNWGFKYADELKPVAVLPALPPSAAANPSLGDTSTPTPAAAPAGIAAHSPRSAAAFDPVRGATTAVLLIIPFIILVRRSRRIRRSARRRS